MKRLLIILLTLFSLTASAQTTDTVRLKIHGGIGGGISESKIAQMISDSLATLDLSGYTKEQVDSIATVIRSEITSGGITQAQLDDSTAAIRNDFPTASGVNQAQLDDTATAIREAIPDTSNLVKKNTYFPLNLIAPLIPKDSFTAGLDSLKLPPLRYSLTNRRIDTDTSLTDKKYVDSSLSLKVNNNTVVRLTGTDTISGIKIFNDKIGINNNNPLAPLHVGNANISNSIDPEILVSRNVDNTGTGNAHGYSDASQITRGGTMAYASYDGRINILGTNSFDHYAAFQAAPTYGSSGTITNLYGIFSLPTITSGIVTNNYGAFIERASVTGGSIVNDYGLFIDAPIAGTSKNYAIYSNGSALSYLGGNLSIGKTYNAYGGYANALDLEGGITIHRPSDALNTYLLAAFNVANSIKTSVKLDNADNVVFTNNTSGKYIAFYTDVSNLALVLSGGKVGIGKIPIVPLDIVGNVATTGTVTSTQYKLSALNTAPASATATGTLGEIRVVADYIYVCTATNTWVRAALTTW